MTKVARLGNCLIGGDNPIVIQSMLKRPISHYSDEDLVFFYNIGCDAMRFSIINEEEEDIRRFVGRSKFAVIADIQGNLNQALLAINSGCHGIRINPGNFSYNDLEKLLYVAIANDTCIRIGVNEASLGEKDAIFEIKKYIDFFTSNNFDNIVVSIKSSSLERSIALNEEFASKFDYPLHIGLTEAGFSVISAVRSTLFFSTLLSKKIGSTIRYSISSGEEDEIISATELLSSLKLRKKGLRIISCPMCARHGVETDVLSRSIMRYIFSKYNARNLDMTLAVMGCAINGRGEAKGADIAICAISSGAEIYKKGELVYKCKTKDEIYKAVISCINDLILL